MQSIEINSTHMTDFSQCHLEAYEDKAFINALATTLFKAIPSCQKSFLEYLWLELLEKKMLQFK